MASSSPQPSNTDLHALAVQLLSHRPGFLRFPLSYVAHVEKDQSDKTQCADDEEGLVPSKLFAELDARALSDMKGIVYRGLHSRISAMIPVSAVEANIYIRETIRLLKYTVDYLDATKLSAVLQRTNDDDCKEWPVMRLALTFADINRYDLHSQIIGTLPSTPPLDRLHEFCRMETTLCRIFIENDDSPKGLKELTNIQACLERSVNLSTRKTTPRWFLKRQASLLLSAYIVGLTLYVSEADVSSMYAKIRQQLGLHRPVSFWIAAWSWVILASAKNNDVRYGDLQRAAIFVELSRKDQDPKQTEFFQLLAESYFRIYTVGESEETNDDRCFITHFRNVATVQALNAWKEIDPDRAFNGSRVFAQWFRNIFAIAVLNVFDDAHRPPDEWKDLPFGYHDDEVEEF